MDHPPFAERAIAEPGFGQIIERMAKKEADQAEQDVRMATSDLYSRVDNFLQSKLKASLEALRNRSIAHNTELTRKEKQAIATGSRIDPVKIGDEEQALKLSTSIITDLNLLFDDLHINIESSIDVWSQFAADFWERISAEPKGRPQPKVTSGDQTEPAS